MSRGGMGAPAGGGFGYPQMPLQMNTALRGGHVAGPMGRGRAAIMPAWMKKQQEEQQKSGTDSVAITAEATASAPKQSNRFDKPAAPRDQKPSTSVSHEQTDLPKTSPRPSEPVRAPNRERRSRSRDVGHRRRGDRSRSRSKGKRRRSRSRSRSRNHRRRRSRYTPSCSRSDSRSRRRDHSRRSRRRDSSDERDRRVEKRSRNESRRRDRSSSRNRSRQGEGDGRRNSHGRGRDGDRRDSRRESPRTHRSGAGRSRERRHSREDTRDSTRASIDGNIGAATANARNAQALDRYHEWQQKKQDERTWESLPSVFADAFSAIDTDGKKFSRSEYLDRFGVKCPADLEVQSRVEIETSRDQCAVYLESLQHHPNEHGDEKSIVAYELCKEKIWAAVHLFDDEKLLTRNISVSHLEKSELVKKLGRLLKEIRATRDGAADDTGDLPAHPRMRVVALKQHSGAK